MVVESGDRLVGIGGEVDVTGSESVRVGSMGAVVELSGSADMEYVGFVWRSSVAFDEYSVALPSAIADVSEVIVVAGGTGGARVQSRGGTAVWMELQAGVSGGWTRVWTTTLGEGSYFSESAIVMDGFQQRYWGTHYDRLLRVKQAYDPDMFLWCRNCVGSDL